MNAGRRIMVTMIAALGCIGLYAWSGNPDFLLAAFLAILVWIAFYP